MRTKRLRLADGTRLGSQFSQRVWDALERGEIRNRLPGLRRGHCRIRASDGSIHDFPQRHISQALGIDRDLTLIDNAALQEHDRQVFRTLRLMFIAAQNLQERFPHRFGGGAPGSSGSRGPK